VGLYKTERILSSSRTRTYRFTREKVLNLCANNYLGSRSSLHRAAAHEALDRWGYGLASVRLFAERRSCTRSGAAAQQISRHR
jgi:glycine C-acetyltransferase